MGSDTTKTTEAIVIMTPKIEDICRCCGQVSAPGVLWDRWCDACYVNEIGISPHGLRRPSPTPNPEQATVPEDSGAFGRVMGMTRNRMENVR